MKKDFNFFAPYLDKWRKPFMLGLSAAILFLTLAGVLLSGWYFENIKHELINRSDIASNYATRPDIVKLTREYAQSYNALLSLEEMARSIDHNLSELSRISYLNSDMVSAVAGAVPDGLRILSIEIADGVVSVAGRAANEDQIPAFQRALKELGFIAGVNLSNIVENSDDNYFSFAISAEVRDVSK